MDLAASQGRLAMVEWLDSMASPFGRVACTYDAMDWGYMIIALMAVPTTGAMNDAQQHGMATCPWWSG